MNTGNPAAVSGQTGGNIPARRGLTPGGAPAMGARMDTPEDEQAFLRDLVKASRQRVHHVHWTDRDGTSRQTALTPAEAVRLNTIAQRLGVAKGEVLRQAAHIPVAKPAAGKPRAPEAGA